MIPGLDRPMQLLRGQVDRLRGLTDGFSAYNHRACECGCCEVIVVRIYSSSHNFYAFGVYQNPDLSDKIFHC